MDTKWGVAVLDARSFDVIAGVKPNMRAKRSTTANSTPLEAAALFGVAVQNSSVNRQALEQNIFGYGLTRDLPGNALPTDDFNAALAEIHSVKATPDLDTFATLKNPSWRSAFPNIMGVNHNQRHDVALIGNFLVATLSKGSTAGLPQTPAHPAHSVQALIGQAVFEYA